MYALTKVEVDGVDLREQPNSGTLQGHTIAAFEFGISYQHGTEAWLEKMHDKIKVGKHMMTSTLTR